MRLCEHVRMPYSHLSHIHQYPTNIENLHCSERTDCRSYIFCSLWRSLIRISNFSLFFSSSSSACNLSLSCCFFSMSARRFCAVDDELWDRVPSRAPNNLCPRFRSSSCPVLRRSLNRSDLWGGDPSLAAEVVSIFSS